MKNISRFTSVCLAVIMGITPFLSVQGFAQNESQEVLLYKNTFNNGSNSSLKETEHTDFYYPGYNEAFKTALNNYEYASEAAPGNYSVSMKNVAMSIVNNNVGIRLPKETGSGNGPVLLFDFRYSDADKTPSRTPNGLRSGKYALSFDFSVQGDAYNSDGPIRILANCFHGNTASNLVHFENKSWSVMAGSNSWTYSNMKNMPLDADKVYNYKMVLNLDEHKVEHYLDGEFVGEITGYKRVIEFFMISMNGDFDYFDNVMLTKEIRYPVEYEITSDKDGNNFYGEEEMKLTVLAENCEDADLVENVVVKATNPQGDAETVVLEKELLIPANSEMSFEILPDFDKYGSWIFSVESENSRKSEARVARIVEVETLNPQMGVCFHMDGRHSDCDIEKGFDLMEKAGLSIVRSDFRVSLETEDRVNEDGTTVKVPVSMSAEPSEWSKNAIRESKEHGIDILPILYINKPGCFGSDADGGYNTNPESLELISELAKTFALEHKDNFKYFELGNEDNYYWKPASENSKTLAFSDKKAILNLGYIYTEPGVWNRKYPAENYTITVNDGKVTVTEKMTGKVIYDNVEVYEPESGADYAKILKVGYDGIKSVYPEAVVMNSGSSVAYIDDGGTIRNQYEFAAGLLGEIQANPNEKYYDAFAVHSYHGGSAPEEGDRWKRYMDFMEQQGVLTGLLEDYGQTAKNPETGEVEKDVERWATEIGYSSSWEEERHYAAWALRLMALNFKGDEYGPFHDKYIIYALFNHAFDKAENTENTYGIVNNWNDEHWYKKSAYAVKEPYLVVAQWNKLMNGLVYNEEKSLIRHTSDGKYDADGDEILTAGLFNLKFSSDDGREVNVIWDASDNNEVTTVAADRLKKMTVYDMYGNIQNVAYSDALEIKATQEPVYVEIEEADLFEITSLKITADKTGKEVTFADLSSAAKVYAEVKYKNVSLKEQSFNLMAGIYSDERLVDTVIKKVEVLPSANLDEKTEYLEIPLGKVKNLSVKGFAVKDFDNMTPLCESVKVSENAENVLYYNTFPTGSDADVLEVEHELYYFYGRNQNLKNALNVTHEYSHAQDDTCYSIKGSGYKMALDALLKSEYNGNMGVRVDQRCSIAAGPVVMLDFRYCDADKTPTKDGALKSGVYKFGFDFILDGKISKIDGFRVEANCMHGNCGNSFAWCMDTTWHNLAGGNTWTYTEQDVPITNEELHHYEIIFDLDENKVITYMDGVRRKDTGYSGNIKFLHLTMGGKMKYVDNVEFSQIHR